MKQTEAIRSAISVLNVQKWEKEKYEKAPIYASICRVFKNFTMDATLLEKSLKFSVGEKVYLLFSDFITNFKRGYTSDNNNEKIMYWNNCLYLLEDSNALIKILGELNCNINILNIVLI